MEPRASSVAECRTPPELSGGRDGPGLPKGALSRGPLGLHAPEPIADPQVVGVILFSVY